MKECFAIVGLAASSGTVVANYLANNPSNIVLNEINPFFINPPSWNPLFPLNAIYQSQSVNNDFKIKLFKKELESLLKFAQHKNIILRLHSHSDYFFNYNNCYTNYTSKEKIGLFSKEITKIISLENIFLLIRDPFTQYYSMFKKNFLDCKSVSFSDFVNTYELFLNDFSGAKIVHSEFLFMNTYADNIFSKIAPENVVKNFQLSGNLLTDLEFKSPKLISKKDFLIFLKSLNQNKTELSFGETFLDKYYDPSQVIQLEKYRQNIP